MTDETAEPLGDVLLADFLARRRVAKARQAAAGRVFEALHIRLMGIVRDAVNQMDEAGATPAHIQLVLKVFADAVMADPWTAAAARREGFRGRGEPFRWSGVPSDKEPNG